MSPKTTPLVLLLLGGLLIFLICQCRQYFRRRLRPTAAPGPVTTPPPQSTVPASGPQTRPKRDEPLSNHAVGSAPRLPALLAVPSATEQERSRKLFKEAFADELKAGTPAGRISLAGKLLTEADKLGDNPSDRFVLLIGSCRAATEGLDLQLAAQARKAAALYKIDAAHLCRNDFANAPEGGDVRTGLRGC